MAKAVVKDYATAGGAWIEVNGERVDNIRFANISFDDKLLKGTMVIEQPMGGESESIGKSKRDVRSGVQRKPRAATRGANKSGVQFSDSEPEREPERLSS